MDTRRVMVALTGRNAVGLDVDTGETLWTLDLPIVPMSFVCYEAMVICTGVGHVLAVSMSGELLWHNELPGLGLQQVMLAVPSVTKSGRL